ncbi:MAG: hypothetical protein ABR543_00775 [Gemmatimonadaceae bacterium]
MPDRDALDDKDVSLTEPHSAPPGELTPDNVKADSDTVAEGAGGLIGGVGGMALGAMGGPIGLVIGGIAGAVGGWWAGRGISNAITDEDDALFQSHYRSSSAVYADRSFEDLRPAYVVGHLAGSNPDYAGRSFEEIEADLKHGWKGDVAKRSGEWASVREGARAAFDSARASGTSRTSPNPAMDARPESR